MDKSFAALVAREEGIAAQADAEPALLAAGDVLVRVRYSSVNYKDALALCGKGRILRRLPMIPGVDYAGEVVESESPDFAPGDLAVNTGAGAGEKKSGGYAEYACADSATLTRLPDGVSPRAAAAVGTAGVTAALCALALFADGRVKSGDEVAVSGASGGVGSFAVALLAAMGCKVAAVSRPQAGDYLRALGAAEVLPREQMAADCKPLESARWAGGVDAVGGKILARMLAETKYNGVVAACGLAADASLPTTVMPFILRNVRLEGIDSVGIGRAARARAWELIARHIDDDFTAKIAPAEVGLNGAVEAARSVLAGDMQGRALVVPKL